LHRCAPHSCHKISGGERFVEMAALRQEHRYGLSCSKIHKNSPNQTLFHVKLTDTAIRTLETYQNLKASLSNQPAICFKGSQGKNKQYIKIPAPTPDSPDAFRVFSFYLSSDSKDKPQSSFDCIHQYVSGEGRDRLEGQGSIQDKITVCATDDSYQTTRERMSQVEKDIWSRTAIEIKPGPSKCIKVQRKQAVVTGSDSSNKLSPSNKRSLVPSPVAHRPLRDRIVHLLALKPYRKPELLLWLERERAAPKDKADLTSVLDEVGKLNPKDSYALKDEFYRHVQRDWPGYLEEEKQFVHRLLIRSTSSLDTQNTHIITTEPENPVEESPVQPFIPKSPHGLPLLTAQPCQDSLHGLRGKEKTPCRSVCCPRTPPTVRPPKNKDSQSSVCPHRHPLTEDTAPASLAAPPAMETPLRSSNWISTNPATTSGRVRAASACSTTFNNGQHKKKRSKKHKDKERERLKPDWLETSPDLKQNQDKLRGKQPKARVESVVRTRVPPSRSHSADHEGEKTPVNQLSEEELPDYLIKYRTITALEQRQRYKEDFCAEYDEYRALHDRIGAITEMFVQLGSKINTLTPGTQEYKIMEDQILQKYRKYKK
uniref:Si:ch211-13k12.2 n=1 Tax=Tetraodon nigroviridis TaxID=99883 RepID=H3CJU7_TETNG